MKATSLETKLRYSLPDPKLAQIKLIPITKLITQILINPSQSSNFSLTKVTLLSNIIIKKILSSKKLILTARLLKYLNLIKYLIIKKSERNFRSPNLPSMKSKCNNNSLSLSLIGKMTIFYIIRPRPIISEKLRHKNKVKKIHLTSNLQKKNTFSSH